MLFYHDQTMAQIKRSISPLKEKLVVHCYDDVEQLLVKHLDQKEAVINEINETREIVKKFVWYGHVYAYVCACVCACVSA